MMSRDEARARVKDAADAELVERLEHLDALRANPPRDDDAPPRPDDDARADYDVVLAGGGLSVLYAPMLARLGLRLAVFERARAAAAHREWNASHRELHALSDAGGVYRRRGGRTRARAVPRGLLPLARRGVVPGGQCS
jgi:lycopene cyclase CruA